MSGSRKYRWIFLASLCLLVNACLGLHQVPEAIAPESLRPQPVQVSDDPPPAKLNPASPVADDRPMPINLPTALQLAGSRPIDIDLASQRIQTAITQFERAEVLWLPSILVGGDYFRHDGQIQDVGGGVFGTSKSSLMAGVAPIAVFAVTDAVFEPLAARQIVRARQAELQATRNDSLQSVAEAYFNVQQARAELAGATDAARRADELVVSTKELAKDLAAPVDLLRARAEQAKRHQAADAAREHWRTASATLARLLRLEPSALVEPLEPPHLRVTLVPPESAVIDLISVALTNRPELASQQALVEATLTRLRQERLRPFIPSVVLRGASTNPAGTLAAGVFGGGRNDSLNNFGARGDFDIQVLWELRNLGLDNIKRVDERRSESQTVMLDAVSLQDRVAEEVVQAHAQVRSAVARVKEAERGVKDAVESANEHMKAFGQTDKIGNRFVLIIRPQEAVASVQALAQAYADFSSTVGDYNRAQFRLYRALGNPAQALAGPPACSAPLPPAEAPAPEQATK
jgi:outer membrane protein TolC